MHWLNTWNVSAVDLIHWLSASLLGLELLERSVSSNMKEYESRPSFVSWLRADGQRQQHDTPRHSRVIAACALLACLQRVATSPPRESVHFSSCKLELPAQRPGQLSTDRPYRPCQVHFMDFIDDRFKGFCSVRSATKRGCYFISLSYLLLTSLIQANLWNNKSSSKCKDSFVDEKNY